MSNGPTGPVAPDEPRGSSEQQHRPLPPAHVLPPPHGGPPVQRSPGSWGEPGSGQFGPPPQLRTDPSRGYDAPPGYGYPPPPWGHVPWGRPVQRRRRSPLSAIMLALVGIAAAGLFVLILVGAATDTGTGTGTVTDAASADHRPVKAENPGSRPVDPSNARGVVERDTLYSQGGLANGNCPAKRLGDATREEQTAFYQALMSCLNDEWRPVVEGAGYSYDKPGLVVFDSPIDTPCGNASPLDGRTLAFYCPGDSVMYADVPQMRKFFDNIDVAYAIVIGHEFGHHVQQETGILSAYDDLAYDDFGNRLELNRRVELQASCMGGLFLGAVADSFPMDDARLQRLEQVAGSFGDEPGGGDDKRDHGSGASNREWIFKGYADNDTNVCNTFTAPSSQVE